MILTDTKLTYKTKNTALFYKETDIAFYNSTEYFADDDAYLTTWDGTRLLYLPMIPVTNRIARIFRAQIPNSITLFTDNTEYIVIAPPYGNEAVFFARLGYEGNNIFSISLYMNYYFGLKFNAYVTFSGDVSASGTISVNHNYSDVIEIEIPALVVSLGGTVKLTVTCDVSEDTVVFDNILDYMDETTYEERPFNLHE